MKTSLLYTSLCLLLAWALTAGENAVEVTTASDQLLESHPRRIVTSVFFIDNEADKGIDLTPTVDLPPGWHLITSDRMLRLDPGQREMSLVSFLIPRTAQAGSYKVGFSVHADNKPGEGDSSAIRVDIMPVTKLRLEILERPDFVVAGETYAVTAVVMNQGNTTTDVEVTASSSAGFPMTSGISPINLPPGESAAFRLSVSTDPGIRRVVQERLSITARALREPRTRDQAWCYLEILPRVTGMRSRFNEVPVMASVSYFNEQQGWDGSKVQASWRGAGNLDERGHQHVDFLVRGPDLGQNRLLGDRDEYFLNYRYGGHSVILGDHSYSVSPLTEDHRYGRGGEAAMVLGHMKFGGYRMKARWNEPDEEQTAGLMEYRLGEESMVGLRYLKKKDVRTNEMMSLETRLQPAEGTDLETEFARTLDHGEGNDAYRLKLAAINSWGSYLLRFIRAGAGYEGYYSNMDFISTSLGLRFMSDFRCDASFRQERHNLNLDPEGYTAPLERDYRLRLLFRSGMTLDYSLACRFRDSRDRFPEGIFDFRERSVRAALGRRYDRLDYSLAAEIGRTLDRLRDRTDRLERYSATLRMRPTSRQAYHGFLYYDRNGGPGVPSSVQGSPPP